MRPTRVRLSDMPDSKHYIGWWGNMGGPKQKGIVSYTLSPFKQSPMRGVFANYLFYGYKRLAAQAPYWIVPFGISYAAYTWATKKYHWINSKEGHVALAEHGGH